MSEAEGRSSRLRSYGRRQSRRATESQMALRERLLPQTVIALPESGPLDPRALLPEAGDIWLEIGFGDGGHLATLAARHREIGFIGCEPFWNGVTHLLGAIDRENLANVRIWPEDARELLDRLADASIGRVYILFPDPWPKLRHQRRRLVNTETIALLAAKIRPGGELMLVSDHVDYVAAMLETMRQQSDFDWLAETAEDFRIPPEGWVRTKYQIKTEAEGRQPTFLRYRRADSPKVQSSA